MSMQALPAKVIAAIEAPLIQSAGPDELMQKAAHQVALAARAMLPSGKILILAGSGGNGGDGLYAGAELAMQGYEVEALLLGSRVHTRATEAFALAGGTLTEDPQTPDLLIDAILGIGAKGALRPRAASAAAKFREIPTLSVDIPSGIDPDRGVPTGEDFFSANVTVTFGCPRYAHGLSPHCGEVWVADLEPISSALREAKTRESLEVHKAIERSKYSMPASLQQVGINIDWPQFEPQPNHHKYTGSAGILAGSAQYPGAGVLAIAGAIHTTPSMKQLLAEDIVRHLVLQRYPEVVCTENIEALEAKSQAWLFGPGCTDAQYLPHLLQRSEPLVVDASGLNMLTDYLELLKNRKAATILTPHAGEFARLAKACGTNPEPTLDSTRELARNLGATVLLKGRFTLISDGTQAVSVDAGHGWLATPGSGDVLSGIMVGLLAQSPQGDPCRIAARATVLHARAGWIAAQTPSGAGPVTALHIAEAVPEATAQTG
ncbi:bifunctional ADP-dependent NAD(P)H-hydrate dehydratase/NAD(P)H-hydrate epimerase [Corynebacterium gerontici]|uniref:ADP-dependent (S)-NAD(P)H-hydrate dehydratase n=1 Tax=Corynebacterium gerontici TaxID=2079234 RepID=A0A3G6J2V3_9CORY|nr:bifunctional ADP-dependent NAD(P)H-hydrate dehydratase/NAD(P)H-hydrate epimerase [Corynebacterium gerontici]AZA12391.1 Bifunctional NAD(P)H-hydrate repair enzyme Nnr [Corynebacterium gerontici]